MLTHITLVLAHALFLAAEPVPDFQLSAQRPPYFVCDERVIEDRWKLERFVEPPKRYASKPLITREHPWEGTGPHAGGSVLWDPDQQVFRMWYSVWNKEAYYGKLPFSYNVCYAESKDGLHWTKPELGVFEYQVSTANNIIKLGGDKTQNIDVCLNPDPARWPGRFLSIHNQKGGVFTSYSDDGKTFTRLFKDPAIPYHSDTHNNFIFDPFGNRWLLYCRPRAYAGDHKRRVALQQSADLEYWTHERNILVPGETDLPEFYGMPVFRRGALLFGTLQAYDRATGLMRAELAWSGDGEHWSRVGTHPFFADVGPAGGWDAGMVLLFESPVEKGQELWFYYGGFPLPHDTKKENVASIGLLISEKDRLVGLRPSGEAPGFAMTRPFPAHGQRITLNARVTGAVTAELRTDDNKPVKGRTFDDCVPVTQDGFESEIRWKEGGLPESGELVRVVFQLDRAELFTFDLTTPPCPSAFLTASSAAS